MGQNKHTSLLTSDLDTASLYTISSRFGDPWGSWSFFPLALCCFPVAGLAASSQRWMDSLNKAQPWLPPCGQFVIAVTSGLSKYQQASAFIITFISGSERWMLCQSNRSWVITHRGAAGSRRGQRTVCLQASEGAICSTHKLPITYLRTPIPVLLLWFIFLL